MSPAARNALARLGLQSLGERAGALVVGLRLVAVGERAEPLVARERLAAACKIAVLRVRRTCLHEQLLVSSFVINNS
jgi:hypothetical protein